ncbi:MAG: tetratricopeptide repeat protein, partial [Clostridia bacterium]|nr:tetratricopeptide repeat protein [Clostridia bacterium]
MGLIAEVAVQNTAYHFDHLFGYLVPETFAADLQVGCRVMVPFGRGTVLRQAVVIRLLPAEEAVKSSGLPLDKYKSISAVLDKTPLIDRHMIALAEYMRERTFCTLFDALRTMFPAGVNLTTMASFAVTDLYRNSTEFEGDVQTIVDYLSHRTGYVDVLDQALEHYKKGTEYLNTNNIEEAEVEFKKSLELNSDNYLPHYELGTIYSRNGNVDMAIKEWQESISINPNYHRSHFSLGLAFEKQGLKSKAITELQIALKIVQNRHDGNAEQRIYRELERLQRIDDFQKAVTEDPEDSDARLNLGIVYYRQGKYDLAQEEFEKVVLINS